MTRKKVKLAWISCDSSRKASLRKRKNGIMKKVSELSILCDVDALIIIYNPSNDEPSFWPSRPEIQQKLARFQNVPELERSKKTMNQEIYLKEQTCKLQDHLKKSQSRNNETIATLLMHQLNKGKVLDSFSSNELFFMLSYIEEKMKSIRTMIEYLNQVKSHAGSTKHRDLVDESSTEIEHNNTNEKINRMDNGVAPYKTFIPLGSTEKNVGKSFGSFDYENETMRSSYKNFIDLNENENENDMTTLKRYEDINTGFDDKGFDIDTALGLACGNARGADNNANIKKK